MLHCWALLSVSCGDVGVLAIRESVLKSVQLDYQKVKVQSDALLSINFLNGGYRVLWFLDSLVADIFSCKYKFQPLVFKHVKCVKHNVVDVLS